MTLAVTPEDVPRLTQIGFAPVFWTMTEVGAPEGRATFEVEVATERLENVPDGTNQTPIPPPPAEDPPPPEALVQSKPVVVAYMDPRVPALFDCAPQDVTYLTCGTSAHAGAATHSSAPASA